MFSGQTFAINAKRIFQLAEQPPDRGQPNFESFAPQRPLQSTQRFASPFETRHWIASSGILQQFFERLQDARLFFSIAWRPPPVRRIRPLVWRSARCTSARPRLIVTRSSPLIVFNS